jgi:hypothetical protein
VIVIFDTADLASAFGMDPCTLGRLLRELECPKSSARLQNAGMGSSIQTVAKARLAQRYSVPQHLYNGCAVLTASSTTIVVCRSRRSLPQQSALAPPSSPLMYINAIYLYIHIPFPPNRIGVRRKHLRPYPRRKLPQHVPRRASLSALASTSRACCLAELTA